jgi:hypothetical protein
VISARKIRANRRNSLRSTGPKTAAGRATAARNALRHGLRVPILADPAFSEEIELLTRRIIDIDANPELVDLARRIAEAEIDITRIRHVRAKMISAALASIRSSANERVNLRRTANFWANDQAPPSALTAQLELMLEGAEIAGAVRDFGKRLAVIEGYERRALSRRKSAIRAFDEAIAARRHLAHI